MVTFVTIIVIIAIIIVIMIMIIILKVVFHLVLCLSPASLQLPLQSLVLVQSNLQLTFQPDQCNFKKIGI